MRLTPEAVARFPFRRSSRSTGKALPQDLRQLATLDRRLATTKGPALQQLPWAELVQEVDEVSDGDVGGEQPRRRRKRRKGRPKGGPKGGGGSAHRAADALFRLS